MKHLWRLFAGLGIIAAMLLAVGIYLFCYDHHPAVLVVAAFGALAYLIGYVVVED